MQPTCCNREELFLVLVTGRIKYLIEVHESNLKYKRAKEIYLIEMHLLMYKLVTHCNYMQHTHSEFSKMVDSKL
jgi:hypothetical protein